MHFISLTTGLVDCDALLETDNQCFINDNGANSPHFHIAKMYMLLLDDMWSHVVEPIMNDNWEIYTI